KYMEWATPGALSRSRERVASPRVLSRAAKMIRAPLFASFSATTSPTPDVPPVMTTVLPLISALDLCSCDAISDFGYRIKPRVNQLIDCFTSETENRFSKLFFLAGGCGRLHGLEAEPRLNRRGSPFLTY